VALLKVVNFLPVNVKVIRNEVIGRIENLTEIKMEPVEPNRIKSIQKLYPASKEDIKFIEENTN